MTRSDMRLYPNIFPNVVVSCSIPKSTYTKKIRTFISCVSEQRSPLEVALDKSPWRRKMLDVAAICWYCYQQGSNSNCHTKDQQKQPVNHTSMKNLHLEGACLQYQWRGWFKSIRCYLGNWWAKMEQGYGQISGGKKR